MKKIFTVIIAVSVGIITFAQPKEVTLVVSGEGANKTEAINNALRSAIEQSFGTFVSSNTEILNDEVIKDEISTISSGNIKSYSEIASSQSPNGNTFVSLNAVVSIGKLITYAKSHGSSAEFEGNTFAANIQMRELNRKNEANALEALSKQLEYAACHMFDFDIEPDNNPKYYDNIGTVGYVFTVKVHIKSNDTSSSVHSAIMSTLRSICLTNSEFEEYKLNSSPVEILNFNNMEFRMRSNKKALSQFITRIKEAMNQAFFDISVCALHPLSIEYAVDINSVEKTNGIWRNFQLRSEYFNEFNVCSDYSSYSGPFTCPREFFRFNQNRSEYKVENEIFIPYFNSFSTAGSLVTTLEIPVFIKTEDIGNLKGFIVKRSGSFASEDYSPEREIGVKDQTINSAESSPSKTLSVSAKASF